MRTRGRIGILCVVLVVLSLLGGMVPVAAQGGAGSQPASGAAGHGANLDVLFVGAHPDDEAFALSAYGQWNEYNGIKTGVVTITRGEGGGNAAGPEEGPALGILREGEERRAVGRAGIQDIFYLDKVDFYYTVSAPLTEEVWGHDQTLEKVVRIVRETRPHVIITMDPSPTPGNHGNHQYAARLAIEAFYAAADPTQFPDQISKGGLQPWRADKLFRGSATGDGPSGPDCAATFVPAEPTDYVFGVWQGRPSERNGGTSWAEVARQGQREYVSQGWAVFPDVPNDPSQIGCNEFTLIDSRVPFTPGNTSPTAVLEGALAPASGGLPLGTEFYLTTDAFDVVGGQPITVTAHARAGGDKVLAPASVRLSVPAGWSATGDGFLTGLTSDQERTTTFTLTPPANAPADTRFRLDATLLAGGMQGTTSRVIEVVPGVGGTVQALPAVAQFREWAKQVGVPQLDNLILPRLSIGSGQSREVRVDLTNFTDQAQSGTVTLTLPAGFSADAKSKPYSDLAAHGTGSVSFTVTNDDTSLKTANEGGDSGDYDFTVATTSKGASGSQQAALNLVPVTTVPRAQTAPSVDGVEEPGEYTGPSLDLSRLWEGDKPDSPADASGSAKVTWANDALYVIVHVTDDKLGTVLPPSDAKRHWRTDSVEIAIDPRGTAENTSTTFKVGLFPITDDPANGNPPAGYRDADAHQGPIAETAPGMEIASKVTKPYTGYTIETKIPLADLPAAVDPQHMGLNIFIYDSDTQDKTGQTRLGWSTWGGVQGDPYRWGHAIMDGYTPPADRSTTPAKPVMPLDAAQSVDSPQSVLQAATIGIPLAGGPAAPADDTVTISTAPALSADGVTVGLTATGAGKAHVLLWTGQARVADQIIPLSAGQTDTVSLPLDAATRAQVSQGGPMVLVAFEAANGGTASLMAPLT